MGNFQNSVAKLKRDLSRQHAATYNAWPDKDQEAQFDSKIQGLKDKRAQAYADKIFKNYPKEFVAKVFEWSRIELSPLELDRIKTFEDLSSAFIEANPDSVTTEEINQFFDKSGKPRQVADPDDEELGELELDSEGGLIERPRVKTKAPQKEITLDQAKRMSSAELEQLLPHDK